MKQNTPYVKKVENGILVNPITKENPYLFSPHSYLKTTFRMWQTVRNKFFTGQTIIK
jgi:hypothetical protein